MELFHASLAEGSQVLTQRFGSARVVKRAGKRLRIQHASGAAWVEVCECVPMDGTPPSPPPHSPISPSSSQLSPPSQPSQLQTALPPTLPVRTPKNAAQDSTPETAIIPAPVTEPTRRTMAASTAPSQQAPPQPPTPAPPQPLLLPPGTPLPGTPRAPSVPCAAHAKATAAPPVARVSACVPPSTPASSLASTSATKIRVEKASFERAQIDALRVYAGNNGTDVGPMFEFVLDRTGRTAGELLSEIALPLATRRFVAVNHGSGMFDCTSSLPAPSFLRVVAAQVQSGMVS